MPPDRFRAWESSEPEGPATSIGGLERDYRSSGPLVWFVTNLH